MSTSNKATPTERAQTWIPLLIGLAIAITRLFAIPINNGWNATGWPSTQNLAEAAILFTLPISIGLAIRAAKIHDQIKDLDKNFSLKQSEIVSLLKNDVESLESRHAYLENQLAHHRTKLERYAFNEADLGITIDVRVSNFNNFLAYLPIYVGIDFGFFKQEKLDIQLNHRGDDFAAVSALINGDCQFAITDPVFAYEVSDPSNKVRILSPIINKAAVWAASKQPIEVINKSEDLSILTYAENSSAYHLCKAWAAKNDFKSVNIHPFEKKEGEIMEDYLLRMYADGNIEKYDILFLSEPEISWITKKQNFPHRHDVHRNLFSDATYAFTSVLTTSDYIKKNRGEVPKRFIKALRQSLALINSLPTPGERHKFADGPILWDNVIAALRHHTFQCYPTMLATDLNDNDLERIVDLMKANGFFARSISYQTDNRSRQGISRAFSVLKHKTGGEVNLDSKIVHIEKEIGMSH